MKLSIRLQQKGLKNHPIWWIVIAPCRKNIFGRYIEHVGIWSPREGKHMKRQIILNIPRIKYWMAQGAQPTFKVHKFLSMWKILPEPWYYKKSSEQLASIPQKPEQQMTEKQKFLRERRRKRLARTELHPNNYHKIESKATQISKQSKNLIAKQRSQDFENDIIREILLKTEFQKYDRIAQLAKGNNDYTTPLRKKMIQLQQKLENSRAELLFLEKQYKFSRTLEKSNLMKVINQTAESLKNIQQSDQYTLTTLEQPQNTQEYITEDYLAKRIQYELISKKFQKLAEDMKKFQQYDEIITLEEFATHLKLALMNEQDREKFQDFEYDEDDENDEEGADEMNQKKKQYNAYDAAIYQLAQQYYKDRVVGGAPLTKMDILSTYDPDFAHRIYADSSEFQQLPGVTPENLKEEVQNVDMRTFFLKLSNSPMTYIPTARPVHPRPDLKTFYPEQIYEPISNVGELKEVNMDPLDPYQEVLKYHKKKQNKKMEELK